MADARSTEDADGLPVDAPNGEKANYLFACSPLSANRFSSYAADLPRDSPSVRSVTAPNESGAAVPSSAKGEFSAQGSWHFSSIAPRQKRYSAGHGNLLAVGPLRALLVSLAVAALVIGVSFCLLIAVYLNGEGGDFGLLVVLAVIGVALLVAILGRGLGSRRKQ